MTSDRPKKTKKPTAFNGHRRTAPSPTTGAVKALRAFRVRQEKKQLDTSRAIRKYKRVLQQHGYEPGKPASLVKDKDHKKEERNKTTPGLTDKKLVAKTAAKDSKQNKEVALAAAKKEKKRQEVERHRKLAFRKKRTEMLKQKTSRGQPIMKNLVHDILSKLEKEKMEGM
jgi:hypothetical protein